MASSATIENREHVGYGTGICPVGPRCLGANRSQQFWAGGLAIPVAYEPRCDLNSRVGEINAPLFPTGKRVRNAYRRIGIAGMSPRRGAGNDFYRPLRTRSRSGIPCQSVCSATTLSASVGSWVLWNMGVRSWRVAVATTFVASRVGWRPDDHDEIVVADIIQERQRDEAAVCGSLTYPAANPEWLGRNCNLALFS